MTYALGHDWNFVMRVLLITEGTYPYNRGRVSLWCEQLIQHLPDSRFLVLPVVGAEPLESGLRLPSHVELSQTIRTHTPRYGLRKARAGEVAVFDKHFANFLEFVKGDMRTFAGGLLGLTKLGDALDLAALLERQETWNAVRTALDAVQKRPSRLAEVAQTIEWIRASLVPVLRTPPSAELVHSVSTGLAGVQAWLASRIHGLPMIVTEPSVFVREGYLASNQATARGVKLLRSRFYRALARLIYHQADRIITMSASGREWQLRLGAPEARTQVISAHITPGRTAPETILMPNIVWLGPLQALDPIATAFTHVKQLMPAARFRLSSLLGIRTDLDQMVDQLTALQISAVDVGWSIDSAEKGFEAGDVVVLEDPEGELLVLEGNRSGKAGHTFEEAFLAARHTDPENQTALAQMVLEAAQRVAERDAVQPSSTVSLARAIRQMCAEYRLVYKQVLQGDPAALSNREALEELDPARVLGDFEQLEQELRLALED